ncbi:FMN-dependent NADH-azoreductase [Paenibacillus arenosi]|uniref:FMN dependent NADH:quinone oxidoreductase n=1 Tax=Paenibacillus arenosi TaxID=2774142 RepID=A0ABR9B2I3_9BACL|nr:NAD(P)H-dependent oxidoreductase [Paenibacillus arenosi]MBD8500134.1 NAD(P)H-dependent oxidoreductase [Paenibacillus arenosi]
MTKVLVVNSNPKPLEISYSRQLGAHFVDQLKANGQVEVAQLNLYEVSIPLIDGSVLDAWGKLGAGQALSAEQQTTVGRMNEILEQFLAADVVVFEVPMWNLSYPPLFKAYIDNITIAGRTFKYTPEGPQGLVGGKKVVLVESRGGDYTEAPALQFTNAYLQAAMGFIGVTDYSNLVVQGVNAAPDQAPALLEAAKQRAEELAKQVL